MNAQDGLMIRTVLREELGIQWPIILFKAIGMQKALFRETHWANRGGAEASFVRRLALPAAVYAQIRGLRGINEEQALTTVGKLILNVGCREQWSHLKSLPTVEPGGMARLMAFHDLMDEKGAPRFNTRIYLEKSENRCDFLITRCVFMDFFREVNAPKLTRFFCEVDRSFFPEAFPDFIFHRGDSWQNTIAFGESQCKFVFERRTPGVH